MFSNHFKLAWRNLVNNRLFTFLNLLGLSTGLACTILIYLWVSDELNINKFNEKDSRIYQVMQSANNGDGAIENTPGLLAATLPKEIPEVEYTTSVIPSVWFSEKGLFSVNDTHIRADGEFVSKDYFNIFSCRFIEGNANQLFADKNNVALSSELALKLFGTINNVTGKSIGWNQKDFDENYAAIKAMKLKDPVGKTITIWGAKKQIIGVTKDLHFQSLYENIKPCFFDLSMNQRVSKVIVRLKAGNERATIDRLSTFYKTYTGEALDFKFFDDDYQALYVSEERVAALSKCFAGIAIIISCLGLFGLAAFTAQRRRKEIGIRKVIGASVSNISAMLSKNFLKLVLLSLVIAFPIAWWIMNKWLQRFAYRIHITPYEFLMAGIAVTAITIITISFQSIKAAIANPVKSLRTE